MDQLEAILQANLRILTVEISVGSVVKKVTGKPFKSGGKISVVTGFCSNVYTKKLSLVLLDGDSIVELFRCEPYVPSFTSIMDAPFCFKLNKVSPLV